MNRALAFGFALALIAAVALAARPASEFQMFMLLNGQPARWTMTDGGQSGLYASSGTACAPLSGGSASIIKLTPNGPLNLCVRPTTTGGGKDWDGGCNTIAGDVNFGDPVPALTAHYVLLDPAATHVCGVSDAGVIQTAIFRMQ